MKTNNYFLHIFLTMLLCFVGTKTYAYNIAVKNSDGVTIYYNYINNRTELMVTFGGYSGVVNIPSQVTYQGETMSVTSIGDDAFSNCSGLTSVTIGNSVTSIGNHAFQNCSSLTSVTIPNSVTSIRDCAFSECIGLTSVTIPNSVTSLGAVAFANCTGLTSVTIGNSVTSIGEGAFSHCTGLTSVTIPNSVTSIGNNAFWECTGLTSVTIPNSVTSIGDYAFYYCSGLTSMTIGNGVTSIGRSAFYNCTGLTSAVIPNSVINIGESAFSYCTGLTSVTIGNSVTSIGDYAFNECIGLTSVTIPNSVTSIGNQAFSDCSGLTSIVVESGNTCYDSRDNCNAIIETATGTLILGCQTTIIPNSVTSIGTWAFENCTGLTSVTIPNSVTSIGNQAFWECTGLTSVTIGNSVTSIGTQAFNRCTGLTSVTIPNSVTSIGSDAFRNCSGLTSVISKMENPCTINSMCYDQYVFDNATLFVPQGKINKYKLTNYWKKFLHIEEGDPSGGSSEPETCAKPTISYNNGKLIFNSSTEGVSYSYLITDTDIKAGTGEEVNLTITYNVSVYASKAGYLNSETAVGTLCWIDTTPTTEGITGIAQIPANAVLIQANDGFISISGLGDNERVTIYQTDGKQVATAKAYNGSASVATNISKGTPVIVKIGEKAVKVVMQ